MSILEANDFLDESEALYEAIRGLSDRELDIDTDFKDWTINDVIAHLYYVNVLVENSLNDVDAFDAFAKKLLEFVSGGGTQRDFARNWLDGVWGSDLVEAWREQYHLVWKSFADEDPKRRVKWMGPDMSVRSSISARLMETWAHAQAVYDILGIERENTDRIKSIVVLGWNTYGWTFKNRGETPPEPKPFLELRAPSGETWTYGAEESESRIEGDAVEFCQVVTQTRNVSDTDLIVAGESAKLWMQFAQCFAGAPESPPQPGTRRIHSSA